MKIKKLLFYAVISFCFALSFLTLSSVASKATKLEYCYIENTNYLLPKQFAIASYTTTIDENSTLPLSEIYTQITEDKITNIYDINTEADCTSFSIKFSKTSTPSGNLTEYNIKNMLLDTYDNGYWSYSAYEIYKNKKSISFVGSYSFYEEYRINISNTTEYNIILNGRHFNNNTTSTFNAENYALELIFTDESGNNMSDKVSIEGTPYTYDYETKTFHIDARNRSDDFIWLTCDYIKPEHKEFTIISFYDKPKSTDNIINTINVTDNIDGNLNGSITIISDTYSGNETTLGSYVIEIYTSDSANNSATCTLNIYVVDKIAPIVEGSNKLYGVLSKPNVIYDIILESYYINDDYDGNVSDTLIVKPNDYNKNLPGTYQITFCVNDKSGNITETSFEITIKDDIPPVYTIDNTYYIYTSANEYFDLDDMVYVLKRDINIDNAFLSYEICEDSYSQSYDKVGEYKVTLKFNYEDREEFKSINVIVDDTTETKIKKSKNNNIIYASILLVICSSVLFIRKINKAISN